jgi:hypothetical protein
LDTGDGFAGFCVLPQVATAVATDYFDLLAFVDDDITRGDVGFVGIFGRDFDIATQGHHAVYGDNAGDKNPENA